MAMMAMTTNSSTNVNPFSILIFLITHSLGFRWFLDPLLAQFIGAASFQEWNGKELE
jgi:hypothetical protein